MPEKTKRKPDDPEQSRRFIDTAREAEADDADAIDRALKRISERADKNKPPSK